MNDGIIIVTREQEKRKAEEQRKLSKQRKQNGLCVRIPRL